MSSSARDVLAAILGVQKNLLKPEEVARAIAAGQPPGDHLGVKWDKLTDEAEDRLAALAPRDPSAPPPPPRQKSRPGRGSLVAAVVLGVCAAGLAVGLAVAGIAWFSAARQRDEYSTKLAQSEKSDQEAREQGALARKAVTEVFTLAKEHPLFQQEQYREGRRLMLERLRPYHEKFLELQPTEKAARADQADSLIQLAGVAEASGNKDEAEKLLVRSRDSYAALAKDAPNEGEYRIGMGRASNALGELNRQQKPDEALKHFRAARESYTFSGSKTDPGLAAVEANVGDLLWQRRQQRDAVSCFAAAKTAYEGLVGAAPKGARVPEYRHHVAEACVSLAAVNASSSAGRQVALDNARQALSIWEELTRAFPDDPAYQSGLAAAHLALGKIHLLDRRPEEATTHLEQAKAVESALVRAYPDSARYQLEAAEIHQHLGHAQRSSGKTAEARSSYDAACASYRKADPESKTAACRFGLARAERGIGQLLAGKGDVAAARQHDLVAEPLLEGLVKAYPKATDYRAELAGLSDDSGLAARRAGDAAAAVEKYEKARELWSALAFEHDSEVAYWAAKANSCTQLTDLLRQDRPKDADAAVRDAFDALGRIAKAEPPSPDYKPLLRDALLARAALRAQQENLRPLAAKDRGDAAALEPDPGKRLLIRLKRLELLTGEDELRDASIENARILTLRGVLVMADEVRPEPWRMRDVGPWMRKMAEADGWYRKAVGELRGIEKPEEIKLLERVKADPEFAPLRKRDDFTGLLEELGSGEKKP